MEGDISKFYSCHLIDEWEQKMKTGKDDKMCYEYEIQAVPTLKIYMQKYVLPAPGDWPE